MRHLPLLLLLGLAMTTAGCGAAPQTIPADVDVAVHMKDYRVELSVATVTPGTVTFGIKNEGAMEHAFELIRTDLAFDKLPVAGGKASEDGLVKQVQSLGIGKVAQVTADLAAGNYVIICNIAGHYQLGMRTALTVR